MGTRSHFGSLLVRISRAIDRLERDDICCGDLTFQQFETLRAVEKSSEITLNTLAAELAIDQSTASRNVSRLERDGYLSKKTNSTDGRSVFIHLTVKGREVLLTMSCDERDALGALYDRISPDRRSSLVTALSTLSDALQNRAQKKNGS